MIYFYLKLNIYKQDLQKEQFTIKNYPFVIFVCYLSNSLFIMSQEIKEKNDRDYSNGEITVFWRPAKCTHVTTCFNELIEVFDPSKRPWVNMNGAST